MSSKSLYELIDGVFTSEEIHTVDKLEMYREALKEVVRALEIISKMENAGPMKDVARSVLKFDIPEKLEGRGE